MKIFKEFSEIDSIEQWEKQTGNDISIWVSNINEESVLSVWGIVTYSIVSSDGKSVEGVGNHSGLVFVLSNFIKGFKGNFVFTKRFYRDVENQVNTIWEE